MEQRPVVADQAGWQSRRAPPAAVRRPLRRRRLPRRRRCRGAVALHGPHGHEWVAFLLLLPLTAAAPLFRVAVGRNYSLHTGPAFIVAGALVLPPLMVVGLVVALHVPPCSSATRGTIHLFNVANSTLSALAAWLAVEAVGGGRDLRFALSDFAAAVAFVAVNHALLAVMLRLGRGHGFRESGLFPSGLAIELVIAGLGVALGAFAGFNPWLLPALIARSCSRTGRSRRSRSSVRARNGSG